MDQSARVTGCAAAAKRYAGPEIDLNNSMWMLNLYFFVIIFCALRTGQLWSLIPICIVYMMLLYWLTEEDYLGTDHNIHRSAGRTGYPGDWVLDDTDHNMDNTKT